jgi:flagellar basal-body rod protein FlgB
MPIINALFDQSTYAASKKMLDVTALRQQAIASNIANIETPGYKRVDVASSFQQELSQAINSQDTARISNVKPNLVVDSTATSTTRDGNTVQLETEMQNQAHNFLAHSLETQLVSSKLATLRSAITGRSV